MPTDDPVTAIVIAGATEGAKEFARPIGAALGQGVADLLGFAGLDRLRQKREENIKNARMKAEGYLGKRGVTERSEPPLTIAIPLAEGVMDESREQVQDLWARLLANALDPKRADRIRREFIETIKQLEPVDVAIMSDLQNLIATGVTNVPGYYANKLAIYGDAAMVSLLHLEKLGCVWRQSGTGIEFKLSEYSREILRAVEP